MQKFLKNHVFSLIAWILILIISVVALPNIKDLTNAHSDITLPSDVQSNVAQSIQNNWGAKKKNTYEVALVFNKEHGKLTDADKQAINNTLDKFTNDKSKYGIKDSLLPDSNIATRKKLQSKDGTTWVAQFNIAKSHGTIEQVYNQMNKNVKTQGLRTYVTGADVLQHDFSASIQKGIKKTEAITVVFIFIVLIIVFKSPIVPLISLLTVGVSFLTSFSIVMNLVEHANFPFSNFTQVFMVIVLFGIGTDYNILLYDKFKEDLGKGIDKYKAMHDSLYNAGKTILYSGSSILIGFTALSLARFSVYQSAVGVAVGVAVLLVVLLTLNPFFMAVLGKKMFWPVKTFNGESDDKLWHGISASTLKHPIIYLVVLAVVTIPFMLMYSGHLNYDDTDEIADSVPSKQGLLVVQKHFSKGMAEPSYLYIQSKHRLDNEENLKLIDQLTKQLQSSKDVSFATSVTEPYGEPIDMLYVNNQLNTVNDGVDQARSGLGKLSKGSNKLANGANSLKDGADQLQDGTGRLQSGAQQLVGGTSRLQNGANSLQSGTQTLQNGTQQMVNQLQQLSSQLSTQMSGSNKQQLAQLQQALPQINSGIQQLNQAIGGGVDTSSLTNSLSTVQKQAADLESSLKELQSAAGGAGSSVSQSDVQSAIESAVRSAVANVPADQKQAATQAATAAASAAVQSVVQKAKAGSNTDKLQSAMQNAASAAQGLQGSMAAMQQSNLISQLQTLKTQVNTLAQASNQALPVAATALNQLSSGLSQVQSAASQGVAGAQRLNSGAASLNSGAGQLNSGVGQLASQAPQLISGIGQLNSGAGQLSEGAGKLASKAPQLTSGIDTVNSGLGQGETYLKGLGSSAAAKTFYIPKEFLKNDMFKKSMDVYLSPDKKSAQIIVVFNSNPSATEATDKSQELSAMAKKSFQGTALKNAKVAMGGQSSKIKDTKTVASGDFLRTAAIMLIGIGIALMFVTRSLLQPIYILGTLLIAYLCSLSINQWIVKAILGKSMLTWNTPFFSFIMLIALGVDYSIFLMTRYRELETEEYTSPSSRILKACAIIGTVVVSAAIILDGTFAALIPSGIPTLIEVALIVDVGLLILVFILPITLSAAVKLTYEGINFNKFAKKKKAK
ncbi:MMPL family transporter [Lactobacillus kefiranofaciens]|uniref:Drug exporter of the RND superfamily n=1 Tax=Lactobacillus kefiranofaciens TaxID=267818 RepID=A0AAX3UD86_9LACO|nr:MMPL family transporter [Lactobacillus kefiranofaciens]AEG40906.1 RND superfamily resistance-nodulation-cell division:proton (H+) antiporter [Lactobacillus kefiranofaciens subsp. kefiranofaciens]KRM22048.1 RND superfamily resistance-nodulation-cell division proton (H+) antiporter [Lactobacillus kefiranofaciens subsp. kefiranofaciens DSM 5016 = JCM 6985]QFQ68571.1 MMPL family transporter [Lactobacillus kefiranofaciens subsp. kefiranofaciens]WGO85627.1 MMPL family transporter [Lactobacillus ke